MQAQSDTTGCGVPAELKTDLLGKDPEIAICRQFLAPETGPFWRFLEPESGTINQQNGSVSLPINRREMDISGAINCQKGSHSFLEA